jgi:ABC-type sugar transport system substrate-binding protein
MINRSAFVKAAAAAGIALAALGTASVAQARSNVFFSIGANVAPGVTLGVSNAPYYPAVYPAATYYAPAPVYYQPAPVYYEPAPVYYQPAVYVAPRVVTYVRPYGHRHHGRHWR